MSTKKTNPVILLFCYFKFDIFSDIHSSRGASALTDRPKQPEKPQKVAEGYTHPRNVCSPFDDFICSKEKWSSVLTVNMPATWYVNYLIMKMNKCRFWWTLLLCGAHYFPSANARITLNVCALTVIGQVTGVMYTVKFLKHYAQLFW